MNTIENMERLHRNRFLFSKGENFEKKEQYEIILGTENSLVCNIFGIFMLFSVFCGKSGKDFFREKLPLQFGTVEGDQAVLASQRILRYVVSRAESVWKCYCLYSLWRTFAHAV